MKFCEFLFILLTDHLNSFDEKQLKETLENKIDHGSRDIK